MRSGAAHGSSWTGAFATAIAACALFAASTAHADDARGALSDSAVVRIWGTGSCTAFLVRPSVFVTAKHCIQRAGAAGELVDHVDIRFAHDDRTTPTYRSMTAAAVRAAPGPYTGDDDIDGHDFAIVESPVPFVQRMPNAAPLRVFAGDPRTLVGEEVMLLGYGERHASFRLTRAKSRVVEVGRTIIVEPAVSCYGDSGGPLVRVSTGEVVGVASREWPVGSVPCDGSASAARSIFQRIDAWSSMIDDAEAAAVDASDVDTSGCTSSGRSGGAGDGASAAFVVALAFAARRRVRRRAS